MSHQGGLFDDPTPPKWWTDLVQADDHVRVWRNIAHIVWAFCADNVGRSFHMRELTSWVTLQRGAAPASPDRILRALRQEGLVRYVVEDRSQSRYRVTWVRRMANART